MLEKKDLRDNANITYKSSPCVALNMSANDVLTAGAQVLPKNRLYAQHQNKSQTTDVTEWLPGFVWAVTSCSLPVTVAQRGMASRFTHHALAKSVVSCLAYRLPVV
jgi:hypothetical protein